MPLDNYWEKQLKLGFAKYDRHSMCTIKYSIEDFLIPETVRHRIIDKNYNLTERGYSYLKNHVKVLDGYSEKFLKIAAFRLAPYNDLLDVKTPETWEPKPIEEIIGSMIIDLMFTYNKELIHYYKKLGWFAIDPEKSLKSPGEKELIKIAKENNFKAALLYIGLANYVLENVSDSSPLKRLIIQ